MCIIITCGALNGQMLVHMQEHNVMQPMQHVLHLTLFTSLSRVLTWQLLDEG
jgi:hypothetical protein